jgi:hypothetical protein
MRAVFLALMAANLLFFAWSRYYSADESAADGVVLKRSEPEKLKIVPPAAAAVGCLEWGSFTAAEYPARGEGARAARARTADQPAATGGNRGMVGYSSPPQAAARARSGRRPS